MSAKVTGPLWTVDAMAAAMGAERQGRLPAGVTGLSIDTRTILAGEAFFALQDVRDGHEFVDAALKAGAGLAVIAADKRASFPEGTPLLVVRDVLEGLTALARAARARNNGKFIGVTGSVGKTGTKEALRLALSRDGETHASAASYNNHWGVPLSLARTPETVKFSVLEMGMNHANEIAPLTRLVRPHVAIITTVEPVHLEFFKNVEAIADAKAEIFEGVVKGGAAVINRDNPHFARLEKAAKAAGVEHVVSFGSHEKANARLIKVALQADSSTVQANILGVDVTYKLGAPGRHVVSNSLAVLAAVSLAGADLALGALALANLEPPTGRGARTMLAMRRSLAGWVIASRCSSAGKATPSPGAGSGPCPSCSISMRSTLAARCVRTRGGRARAPRRARSARRDHASRRRLLLVRGDLRGAAGDSPRRMPRRRAGSGRTPEHQRRSDAWRFPREQADRGQVAAGRRLRRLRRLPSLAEHHQRVDVDLGDFRNGPHQPAERNHRLHDAIHVGGRRAAHAVQQLG